MKLLILSGCISASILSVAAHGAAIATEQFNYPAGPIAGANGGSGFTSAWRGDGSVNALGQTFPNLATAGGGFVTNGNNQGAFRDLSTFYGTDNTTVFVWFTSSPIGKPVTTPKCVPSPIFGPVTDKV